MVLIPAHASSINFLNCVLAASTPWPQESLASSPEQERTGSAQSLSEKGVSGTAEQNLMVSE